MNRKLIILALFMVLGLTTLVWAQDTGVYPVPIFTDAKVQAEITFDPGTSLYTYTYTITNPATNTGDIWDIDIEIRMPRGGEILSSEGLMIPHGFITDTFDEDLESFKGDFVPMVPVGIHVPPGWGGGLGARGVASFSSGSVDVRILPGETKKGLKLISRGLPTTREAEIEPWWVFRKAEGDLTEEDDEVASTIEESLRFMTKTLGPTAPPRSFSFVVFLETIQGYIDESVTLGWAMDSTMVSTLRTKLDTVRSLIKVQDPSQAKVVVVEFMNIIDQSSSSQLTSEGRGLLFYNAKYLKDKLPDTYVPPVKSLKLTPEEATLPIGTIHTLTATFTVDGNPLPGKSVNVGVISGPNGGLTIDGASTDNNGQAVFSYTSTKVGTDRLVARSGEMPALWPQSRGVLLAMNEVGTAGIVPAYGTAVMIANSGGMTVSLPIEVTWSGGPDLVIPLFIPSIIKSEGGNPIFITDITKNRGNIQAGPSITRYYISDDPMIEPELDHSIGERVITALDPEESSQSTELEFQLPYDLPAGTYYCGACSDAGKEVVELDEENNCENNQLAIIVPLEISPNQLPDCTQARPSVDLLWPPNHKLVNISIDGVTDPDGDQLTLSATGITQDEPVNGLGDGDTSPDGFGLGTTQVRIRAERSGSGNGRVYAITFSADDGKGGVCTGQVTVGVPHDKGKGKIPVDDGQNYDSTHP